MVWFGCFDFHVVYLPWPAAIAGTFALSCNTGIPFFSLSSVSPITITKTALADVATFADGEFEQVMAIFVGDDDFVWSFAEATEIWLIWRVEIYSSVN